MQATEKQQAFILFLIDSRDLSTLDEIQKAWIANPDNLPNLTKDQASRVIGALKDLPWKPKQQSLTESEFGSIPAGYFFIVDPTDGEEKFFKVDKPTEGRWAGYTFLKVQAGSEFWPIKNKQHRDQVFAEIAKNPTEAMNEYGLRLGRCGVCNRVLTARDSRLRGIGPICASRL
jgi:Family of unknown function (DUF6011)